MEITCEPEEIYLGGEAKVMLYPKVVVKKRNPKKYRLSELDEVLRLRRTRTEARIISQARRNGVPTPIVLDIEGDTVVMERIRGTPVKFCMSEEVAKEIGRLTAKMHQANIIHGDITPMNMILSEGRVYFVDFGLAFFDNRIESKGVDVHVFFESLRALFDEWRKYRDAFVRGYIEGGGNREVIERAREIEIRGRYIERRMLQ